MDTNESNSESRSRNKSELEKFRLFFEFAVAHKEIKQDLKQRQARRSDES